MNVNLGLEIVGFDCIMELMEVVWLWINIVWRGIEGGVCGTFTLV